MTKLKPQVCKRCAITFYKKRNPSPYCSQVCYFQTKADAKQYIICLNCGKSVYKVPKDIAKTKGMHFCSKPCSAAYQVKDKHHAYQPESHSYCIVCLAETHHREKYCSVECKGEASRGENSVRFSQTEIKCTACQKAITRTPSHIHGTNFCSPECQNSHHSNRIKGKNNPRYKHGDCLDTQKNKLLYEGFTLKLRKAVRLRDKDTCQLCGLSKESHGMNMHVHHIDYDKTNNKVTNLICLCRYCHSKVHGDEPKWLKILLKKSLELIG